MINYRPCETARTFMNMDTSVSDVWLAFVHGATKAAQSDRLIAEELKCAQSVRVPPIKRWLQAWYVNAHSCLLSGAPVY